MFLISGSLTSTLQLSLDLVGGRKIFFIVSNILPGNTISFSGCFGFSLIQHTLGGFAIIFMVQQLLFLLFCSELSFDSTLVQLGTGVVFLLAAALLRVLLGARLGSIAKSVVDVQTSLHNASVDVVLNLLSLLSGQTLSPPQIGRQQVPWSFIGFLTGTSLQQVCADAEVTAGFSEAIDV